MEKYSFAVFGDNRGSISLFRTLINDLNSDDDIMFSIDNGDLVQNGEMRKYMLFIDQVKKLKRPLLTAVGNHDIKNYDTTENGRNNYFSIFGRFYYSFAISDAYFIVLDNANESNLDPQQMEWLKEQLEIAHKYKYRFVFMHVPLFDPREEGLSIGHSMNDMKFAKQLNSIFDKNNITMLFTSHVHSFYRGVWSSTPYIISGGAGAVLYGKNPEHSFYHYIKVNVSDKGIDYEVRKVKAIDLDTIARFLYETYNAWQYIYCFIAVNYLYVMIFISVLYGLLYFTFLKRRKEYSKIER